MNCVSAIKQPLTQDARSAHLRVAAHGRDGAVGFVDGPHELLSNELADVGAVRLDIAILGRKVARLAHAAVNVLEEVVLECGRLCDIN